ncbi:MAG: hypothetical protein GXP40_13570 [Chloroflexi bacterium]|nr:hypothetical protein [Chloroflexota bacterium]
MKRIDKRIIIGALLILGGILGLLDQMGVIRNASGIFWGLVFGVGGAAFLYLFINDRSNWWAAFPAFTLLGLGASSVLPPSLEQWDGLVFLGGIGLGFWAVYFTGRERWWAIIPGGVLVTLGVVSALDEMFTGLETGGVFFVGLGVTFLLVAVLPGYGRMPWAYIPGVILLVMGMLLGTPYFGLTEYVWPVTMIIGGLALLWFYFKRQ